MPGGGKEECWPGFHWLTRVGPLKLGHDIRVVPDPVVSLELWCGAEGANRASHISMDIFSSLGQDALSSSFADDKLRVSQADLWGMGDHDAPLRITDGPVVACKIPIHIHFRHEFSFLV
jgi:hypothetical protein